MKFLALYGPWIFLMICILVVSVVACIYAAKLLKEKRVENIARGFRYGDQYTLAKLEIYLEESKRLLNKVIEASEVDPLVQIAWGQVAQEAEDLVAEIENRRSRDITKGMVNRASKIQPTKEKNEKSANW